MKREGKERNGEAGAGVGGSTPRLTHGLRRRSLWRRIVDVALTDVNTIVRGGIDPQAVDRMERVLLEADFGVEATLELVGELERAAARGRVKSEADLRQLLEERLREILGQARMVVPEAEEGDVARSLRGASNGGPSVVLLVGVNGTGKTSTAGKLAFHLERAGRRVLLAATDTFRAAAQEQLRAWAERVGTEFVGGRPGGDPGAVVFDAVDAARSRGAEWVIVDTAGRLHTQQDLMAELRKIDRVLARKVAGAPQERLLVVDATSGQNVLNQAAEFGRALSLTGVVLAKFDSSARGGTAVAVAREHRLPVRFLGTGEAAEDLEPFDPTRYLEKLLGP